MARWVKSKQSMRVFKTATTPTVLDGLAIGDIWIDTTTTAVLKVCVAISPVAFSTVDAGDANNNVSANNFISGYTTTATAAATTTLTVASTRQQFFTGVTTQTCVLPVTSTLALGQIFEIVNNSTGVVTVQSSGANTVVAMAAATKLLVTCILTSGTTAASWDYVYQPNASGITGTGSLVRHTTPTFTGIITTTEGLFGGAASGGGIERVVALFSPTSAKGYFEIVGKDNTGNFGVVVQNAAFGQTSTLTIADPLGSTATIQPIVKANGTEGSNLVTASGHAGVITTSALTTTAGSTYVITWTNTKITTASAIVISLMGGTNTR